MTVVVGRKVDGLKTWWLNEEVAAAIKNKINGSCRKNGSKVAVEMNTIQQRGEQKLLCTVQRRWLRRTFKT